MINAAVTIGLPTTIEGWYRLTLQSRAFFEAVPYLDGVSLARMAMTDAMTPARGVLRTKAQLTDLGRVLLPDLDNLRSREPTEQTLQWMWMHRGHFAERQQKIVWRELPTCCAGERAFGRADLLAFDTDALQPIIVELKKATATDALTRTVLEAFWHWVFNMQHLASLEAMLCEFGHQPRLPPRIAIAAPRAYFIDARRRTRAPRNAEYELAVSWIDHLTDKKLVAIEMYAIEDDWLAAGPNFGLERLI